MSSALPDPHLPTQSVILPDDTPPGPTTRRAVPAWIISIVLHGVILMALAVIVVATNSEIDEPAIEMTVLPPPPPEDKPEPERDIDPNTVSIDIVVESETPSPTDAFEITEVEFTTPTDVDADVAQGRTDAIDASEMGQTGAMMAIGPGGGAAGLRGWPDGGGKIRGFIKEGGTPKSAEAADRALRWFKRHQSPNGQWDIDGYVANCTENPKCEPGTEHTGAAGDIAGTGYAILCFLGGGYDHRMPSRYRATVRAGVDWLISVQKDNGLFGSRNYEHSVAAMAIAEAYAMTNDPRLRVPAQKAIDVLLARQIKDPKDGYGLGWDYVTSDSRNDSSVSGWAVMALKSAAAGGLNIGNGMEGAARYLDRAWKAANPDFASKDPYTDTTTFPYVWNSQTGAVQVGRPGSNSHDMAPVGALLAVFLGRTADDVALHTMANHIIRHQFPQGYPTNTYYLYYNTMAMFQVGGAHWQRWNNTVRDLLVDAQRRGDGCFDGSYDFVGTRFHGHQTGRILSTAYSTLCLQVYYRERRFQKN